MQFACPQCRQEMRVEPGAAGHTVRCPGCRQFVQAPPVAPSLPPAPANPTAPFRLDGRAVARGFWIGLVGWCGLWALVAGYWALEAPAGRAAAQVGFAGLAVLAGLAVTIAVDRLAA